MRLERKLVFRSVLRCYLMRLSFANITIAAQQTFLAFCLAGSQKMATSCFLCDWVGPRDRLSSAWIAHYCWARTC